MELTTLLNRSKDSVLNLTVYEFRFLSFLLARVNKDKLSTHGYLAWPGTDQIIEFTGLSKPTIERSRKTLVSAGWMQYTPGHGAGSSNHYYINASKIISAYVASGYDAPDKEIYATVVQEKAKKQHKRNTDNLVQNKKAKQEEKSPEPVQDEPKTNPDGSPKWFKNGTRRYTWDDVMMPPKPVNAAPSASTYYEDLEAPF
jgi:hypothetical protein